jgi:hypothetical protein
VSAGRGSRLARALSRHGLASPARLLLDAHRPLEPLIADLGAAVGPLLASAGGEHRSRADGILTDTEAPGAVDRLIEELDRHQAESRSADAR